MESSFKRETEIEFGSEQKNDVDININHSVKGNDVIISVVVDLAAKHKRRNVFKFTTRYIGVFEIGNEDVLPVEKFAEANGPAIIYPFIREHIATTSLKAGMKPILLPPVNFIRLNQIKKDKK